MIRPVRPATRGAVVAAVLLAPLPGAAQEPPPGDSMQVADGGPVTPLPPRTRMYRPYRVGERLTYRTSVRFLGEVGEGSLTVAGPDTIRGTPTLRLEFALHASAVFGAFTVNDLLQSWLDPATMRALRFVKDQQELGYETHRVYDFFPDDGRWEVVRNDTIRDEGPLASATPLDDISFLYFVRSLPLEVGDRYVLGDYFEEDGNPVVVEVLRRETVRVPAGQFQTVVVKPTIRTEGLFGQGGEAELYFTDDALHLLVMMKSRLPVLQTLELQLRAFELGY